MPTICRAMMRDGEHPRAGEGGKLLGVRINDIPVDAKRNVRPRTGGMSVAPNWRELPLHLIPERLNAKLKAEGRLAEGRARDTVACWRMGSGPFQNEALAEGLVLRIDNETHGLVEPDLEMEIEQFRRHLAATASQWVIDEE